MEINVKEARNQISSLLDRTQKGEEILILRRGEKVARLVPASGSAKQLPDLTSFRASIRIKGKPLSQDVVNGRNTERY